MKTIKKFYPENQTCIISNFNHNLFNCSHCTGRRRLGIKKFEVGDFSEISIEGAFKVYLVQGEQCVVTVKLQTKTYLMI
ncbi:MAG: hypothetical protein IPF54_27385 [Draconibacterium sp.]|nr:hypothetical protein [Draconibacterium sp.]